MDIENLISWRILSENDLDKSLESPTVLIKGYHTDERDSYFRSKMPTATKIVVLTYDHSLAKLSIQLENFSEEINFSDDDPIVNAEDLVQKLIQYEHNIVIDITCMANEAMFILLKAFYDFSYDRLIVTYVQPIEYSKKRDATLMPNFQLSEGITSITSIPGFLRLSNDMQSSVLVFLGFEGGRFKELCEHLLTEGPVEISPIIPLPSFSAGWHMLGLYFNLDTLKSTEVFSKLRRVTAWDPFYALEVLESSYREHSENYQVIVAPLGTKPHTLACALFAIKHEDVLIMYDHPKVSSHRTSGIGVRRVYSLEGLFFE
ncbi:hypothetical protein [Paenibacillus qinlingensis]|uniref:hypothetical protein n=1 Tax=Paenibacillus qinlingensis TaxID=1837343 RepID=UPI0015668FD6|nr:hypothetical protein [Paenibacillus qinlingensis]NQX63548.1 hypothetical protein [Paenibacillus qinlingensis]